MGAWQKIQLPSGFGMSGSAPHSMCAAVAVSVHRSAGRVGAMTGWRVIGTLTVLAALCLLSVAPAGPASAVPCEPSGGLLGVVGLCSSGHSSSASPATATPRPSIGHTVPSPVTPAPGTPAATTFSPSPQHVLEQQTETVPAPATTAAVPPAPAATQSPTSSQTTGPAVVGSGPDSLGPTGPVASPSPLAGILLAVGGCLIAAGGALGLRRFPRW